MHLTPPLNVVTHQTDYAMRIEFGKEKYGRIPAKFYLSLSDDWKSGVSGTFTVNTE